MNGLAETYASEMDCYDLDAIAVEGQAKRREFGMIYHGYAVVDRWGGLYWHSAGH